MHNNLHLLGLTLYIFLAECTATEPFSQDCCSNINLCSIDQGNCKSDADCQSGLTCQDTCPIGFPDGYRCCHNDGEYIFHLS